jgi:ankyrin repeat protein
VTDQETQPKKLHYFAFWVAGLLIPLGSMVLWDSMPRYKAMRKLREAGIEQIPRSVHNAIEMKDLEMVTLLHTARVPLNGLSDDGKTPLIASIIQKEQAITNFLTEQPGVDCDQTDEHGVPPLAHAIQLGNLDVVKKLLPRIQNPNVALKQGGEENEIHALLKATQERDGTLLKLLLTHPNIDVDVRDKTGRTPLHYAIRQDDLTIARALLSGKNQSNPNIASEEEGETPLDFAIKDSCAESVKLLLESGAKVDIQQHALYLLTAIEQSDTETVRHLLDHGVSANAKHPQSGIALINHSMDLAETGCVIELLEAGAHPTGTLRRAIQCGHGAGAQIIATHYHNHQKEWTDKEGLLELAIFSGSPECVNLLLDQGTDPNEFTSIEQRVLGLSIAARQDRVTKRLLKMGADPNLRLQDPPSKAFLGYFEGDAKTTYYLKRDRNLTYLMLAALTEQQSTVSDLISHGAERNAYSARFRRYAVALAAERHNVPIMQLILGREANDKSRTVTVSLKSQRATLYKDGEAVSSSRVSSGKRGNRTPKGTYVITNKHRHHNSSIYGSSMPYFMRLSCSDFGLHYSPNVPSYPASHGCVRMPWSDVKHFYSVLKLGDIVTIE